MALIKCSECGKSVSDKSMDCVNCGCPIKRDSKEEQKEMLKRRISIIIGIIGGIIALLLFISDYISGSGGAILWL